MEAFSHGEHFVMQEWNFTSWRYSRNERKSCHEDIHTYIGKLHKTKEQYKQVLTFDSTTLFQISLKIYIFITKLPISNSCFLQ